MAKNVDRVVIVGAGPVGATVAVALAGAGVPVIVLEEAASPSVEWRASTFHPPALEALEPLGVLPEVLDLGLRVDKLQYRDRRDGLIAEFSFDLITDDTPFPFRLQCGQHKLTEVLLRRLGTLPDADVEFSAGVQDVAPGEDDVKILVSSGARTRTLRAPFVVGADGARSTVRETLGIPFPGFTYETRNLVLSTTFNFPDYLPGLAPVNYVSDPEEWLLLLKTPDVWRVVFPVPPAQTDEDAVTEAVVQARLRGVVPHADQSFPVSYAGVYRVHERVAETFRRGRVLLAGDAGHINSPLGGLGMNAGIHDAVMLADVLSGIWHSTRGLDALDEYAGERRAIALNYVRRQATDYFKMMSERDPERRARLKLELQAIAADQSLARTHLLQISMMEARVNPAGKEEVTRSDTPGGLVQKRAGARAGSKNSHNSHRRRAAG